MIRLYKSSLKVFIVSLIFYQISIDTCTVYSTHSVVYKNIDYIVHPPGGILTCLTHGNTSGRYEAIFELIINVCDIVIHLDKFVFLHST